MMTTHRGRGARRVLSGIVVTLAVFVMSACVSSAAPSSPKPGANAAPDAAPRPTTGSHAAAGAATDTPTAAPSAPPTAPGDSLGIQPRSFNQIVDVVRAARGQVVFFHLYASWCGPCRVEFPEVVELGRRYRAQGLKMVLVSVDERRGDLEAFLRPHNANMVFPAYLMTGSQQEFAVGLRTLGADFQGGIPYTAVYGRDGKLVTEWTGSRNLAHFERVIQPLL